MFELFERVALKEDLPKYGLSAGAIGTVVELYPKTDGLEVEFFDGDGETIAVATLDLKAVYRPSRVPSKSR